MRLIELGCERKTKAPLFTDDDGTPVYRCPTGQVTEESWWLISLSGWLDVGVLPCKGSLEEQPAGLMRRIEVARYYLKKYAREEMEKRNRGNKG